MGPWVSFVTDALWRNALGAIPLAILVAIVCRFVPCRPATRHAMWLLVLLWMIVPSIAPPATLPPVAQMNADVVDASSEDGIDADLEFASGDSLVKTAEAAGNQWAVDPRPATATESTGKRALDSSPRGSNKTLRGASDRRLTGTVVQQAPTPPGTAARTKSGRSERLAPSSDNVGRLFVYDNPTPRWSPRTSPQSLMLAARSPDGAPVERADLADKPDEANPLARAGSDPKLAGLVATGSADARPTTPAERLAKSLPAASPATVDSKDEPVSRLPIQFYAWATGLLDIRDAVGRLPPMPAAVWGLGIGLIVAVFSVRTVRFARRLGRAVPVPADVMKMVRRSSKLLGLQRIPETLFIHERISPMIWCGRRVRLLLPAGLWSDLDDRGREAVLFHELAHLKRRDHWVRWLELLVGWLYWWHPLVWCVRRRLQEEADHCCDAWVTWLRPRQRRAYAHALLATKQYISGDSVPVPAVGMGVATVRAKRFARRLTMVMTQTNTPRLSFSGLSLALALGAAGWLATPARSCPPKADTATVVATPSGVRTIVGIGVVDPASPFIVAAVDTPPEPSTVTVVANPFANDTYRAHMAARDTVVVAGPLAVGSVPGVTSVTRLAPAVAVLGGVQDPLHGLADRLKRLERQNAELNERLDRLSRALEGLSGDGGGGNWRRAPRASGIARSAPLGPFGGSVERAVRRPTAPRTPTAPRAMASPRPPTAPRPPVAPRPPAQGRSGSGGGWFTPRLADDDGEKISRSYTLPKNKLEKLIQLMALQDVPILISGGAKSIEVQATRHEHEVFKAFVDMIHPEGAKKGRTWRSGSGGSGGGLFGGTSANAQMRSAELALVAAERDRMQRELELVQAAEHGHQAETEAKLHARMQAMHAEELVAHAEALARQAANKADVAHRTAETMEAQLQALEREIEAIESKADEVEDYADELDEQAEELRERASDADEDAERAALHDKAAVLSDRAAKVRQEASAFESKISTIEAMMEALERQMESHRQADD